jgi:branched-chain amino acid transport system substrate-binding protein
MALLLLILPFGSVNAENTVYLGGIYPMSGGAAFMGISWDRGLQLACEEINKRGGITVAGKKYQVKGISYDDEMNPAKSVAGLRKLKLKHNIPVYSMAVSSCSLATLKVNQDLGVLWLGLAIDPRITASGNKLVLRMPPVGTEVSEFAKNSVDIFGKADFAVIASNDDWGHFQEKTFKKVVTERGAEVVASEWFAPGTDTDFYPQWTKIKPLNPKAVYVVAHDEQAVLLIKQAKELGINCPFVFPMGSLTAKGRAKLDPKMVEGFYIGSSKWDLMGPTAKRLAETYQKRFKDRPIVFAGVAWEAAWIAAKAMEKAGTVTDAHKIREAALKVVPLPEDIAVMEEQGFDPKTGQGYWWTALLKIENGKFVLPKEIK